MKSRVDTSDYREKVLIAGQQLIAARGFSNVGLSEILTTAKVPKGSFYYYFNSKEAFGEALLNRYFDAYVVIVDEIMSRPGLTMAERLRAYLEDWESHQTFADFEGRCLAVKLGAEVADLSETMRLSLKRGTSRIIERLADAVAGGKKDGSITAAGEPKLLAENLYNLWMGASVMAKIHRDRAPLASAMVTTEMMLKQ